MERETKNMKNKIGNKEIFATPKKLDNGAWGVCVKDIPIVEGDFLTVVTKAGKQWYAIVTEVVWYDLNIAYARARKYNG